MSDQRVVGFVGAAGLIIQIILGFALADSAGSTLQALLGVHMVIGVAGLALVAFIVGRAYYSTSSGVRLLYIITFLLVLAQVALGFRVLAAPDEQLRMSHQGNAFAVLVLLGITEVMAARQRRRITPEKKA